MISPGISDHFKLHKQYLMSELLKFAVLVMCIMHTYTRTVYFLFIQNAKDFFFWGGGCLHIIPGLVIAML